MKKTNILIIVLVLLLILIVGIIILLLPGTKEEKDNYITIKLKNYEFDINEKYKYEYLKEKEYGVFKNKDFLSSYIYISNKNYSQLISYTSNYTNMNSEEINSIIEEKKFNEYESFINVKEVLYDDNNKKYELVIILVKLSEEETLVIQYEIELEKEKVLEDIKKGLSSLKKEI